MKEPAQVPVHVLQHHLTLVERSARQCRELLSLAQHSGVLAQQPQVVTPDVLHRMNGNPGNHYANQAQQCAAAANQELRNLLAQVDIVQALCAGDKNGGQDDPEHDKD